MSFNSDTFGLMLKFGVTMLGILLAVWLIAYATPFLAKIADKLLGKAKPEQGASSVPAENTAEKSPARVDGDNGSGETGAEEKKPAEYRVYDIYEGSTPDDDAE